MVRFGTWVTKDCGALISLKSPHLKRSLLQGGFARCYELLDVDTNQVYAGKIVSKSQLVKASQKEKMSQEIAIHRSLKHKNVVDFHHFFEDSDNVYIILELCRRRSLMEMHKRRKTLSEPEVRYFVKQIAEGCLYLHKRKVIHRDLKLGNLFLNDRMELKVGDFGLATLLDYDGERKRTLCGTPNYIAPEVLTKKGHSYEVDSWSLGCIIFTLLVGKPPFETSNITDTYNRIKRNEYHIPSRVDPAARSLINNLLHAEPSRRYSMEDVLKDKFLTRGFIPSKLPTSCLTMAPRFEPTNISIMIQSQHQNSFRKPLSELNHESKPALPPAGTALKTTEQQVADLNLGDQGHLPSNAPPDAYLSDLHKLLQSLVLAKPCKKNVILQDEAEDPAAVPIYWISKWVDYTDKYGIGYQLSDNSVGVLFNDLSRLVMLPDNLTVHYIERDGTEHYYTTENYASALIKKVTLLTYFNNYMNEHLLKATDKMSSRETDEISRMPYLKAWFRTRSAIVFHLTNGILQVNFFQDHTKLIICPLMEAVTYIDEKRDFRTYRLKSIEKFGCTPELFSRLQYALTMVERLQKGGLAAKSNMMPGTAHEDHRALQV
ncbi:PLK1 [Cordylochernes scorpioides]|uniref:polo kinase n=1 Tax=Cordylochernes scorpioides TaxID=51811 RepID=A0ABY6K1H7_9ARAC|nr:PLK1 [Cordylochernes scorpioides]